MGERPLQQVCWFGGTRYSRPLNPTNAKKWQALTTLGVDLRVIAFSDRLRPYVFEQGARFYLLPKLPLAPLRYLTLAVVGSALLWVLIALRRVDVVIAQSPYEGAMVGMVKALSWRRVRVILESHGDFEQAIFLQKRLRFSAVYRAVMRPLAAFAFRQADAFRTISSITHAQVQPRAGQKPIVRFMTWTDSDAFRTPERSAPPSQSHEIVYCGVLTPLKAVHVLIEAFAQLADTFPHATLTLIGTQPDAAYAQGLRAQIATAGLSARVHFAGGLNQDALADHLRAARVLVLPSLSEGLGRVLVEAMLCGTPVIASNVGGIPDVVTPGENGWLTPPGDAHALADALHNALTDPARVDAYGRNGRTFAERFFSADAYIEGYSRLLKTVQG